MKKLIFIFFLFSSLVSGKEPPAVTDRLNGKGIKYVTELSKKSFFELIVKTMTEKKNILESLSSLSRRILPGTALYISKKTLLDIDSLYRLKLPWMINAPVSNGRHLSMEAFIIMKDNIIIGYPNESKVTPSEYKFMTSTFTFPETLEIAVSGSSFKHKSSIGGPLFSQITGFRYSGESLVMIYKYFGLELEKEFKNMLVEPRKTHKKSPFNRSSFY